MRNNIYDKRIRVSRRAGAYSAPWPDVFGEIDLTIGGHRVYLGRRRLSILDLSPADNQPMQSSDGSKIIIYNDEVYYRQELHGQLNDVHFVVTPILKPSFIFSPGIVEQAFPV